MKTIFSLGIEFTQIKTSDTKNMKTYNATAIVYVVEVTKTMGNKKEKYFATYGQKSICREFVKEEKAKKDNKNQHRAGCNTQNVETAPRVYRILNTQKLSEEKAYNFKSTFNL